jgi:hypothetical protein
MCMFRAVTTERLDITRGCPQTEPHMTTAAPNAPRRA